MRPSILSIAKAPPHYSRSQQEILERTSELTSLKEVHILKKIYQSSCIERRYSVLPDLLLKPNTAIGMSERNAHYKREAPLLAERAAQLAIEKWQGKTDEITHVITSSCTGAISPGLEIIVARLLKLKPNTHLLGVNMMGCFGAFKALKVAAKIAKESPKNRILCVSTETCSLHIKPPLDIEAMVIHSLFGDGSAAVVVGNEPRNKEVSLFELLDESTYRLQDSEEDITWDASDLGFDMTLSARVPKLISQHIQAFMHQFLGTSTPLQSYEWAIHPGGKAIIEAIENALQLSKDITSSSWKVLKDFGNMSSTTFLYILEDLYQRKIQNKKIVGIGFGPGVAIEGLLLECGKSAR